VTGRTDWYPQEMTTSCAAVLGDTETQRKIEKSYETETKQKSEMVSVANSFRSTL